MMLVGLQKLTIIVLLSLTETMASMFHRKLKSEIGHEKIRV